MAGRAGGEVRAKVRNAEREAAQDEQDGNERETGGDQPLQPEAESELELLPDEPDAEHHRHGAEAERGHVFHACKQAAGGDSSSACRVNQATGKKPVEHAEGKH